MQYFLILLILVGFTGTAFVLSDGSQMTATDTNSENRSESKNPLTICL
jgi:hypothetical protein